MKITKPQLLQLIKEELQINHNALTLNTLPGLQPVTNNSLVNEIVLREYIRETLHYDQFLNESGLKKWLIRIGVGIGGAVLYGSGGCIDEIFGVEWFEDIYQEIVITGAGEVMFVKGLIKGGARGAALTLVGATLITAWNIKPDLFQHEYLAYLGLQPNHEQRSVGLILGTLAMPVLVSTTARNALGATMKAVKETPMAVFTRIRRNRPAMVREVQDAIDEVGEAVVSRPIDNADLSEFVTPVERIEPPVSSVGSTETRSFDDHVADLGPKPPHPMDMEPIEYDSLTWQQIDDATDAHDAWIAEYEALTARDLAGEFDAQSFPDDIPDESFPDDIPDESLPDDWDGNSSTLSDADDVEAINPELNTETISTADGIVDHIEVAAFISMFKKHEELMTDVFNTMLKLKRKQLNDLRRTWGSWIKSAELSVLRRALRGRGSQTHRGFILNPVDIIDSDTHGRWIKIHAKAEQTTTDGYGSLFSGGSSDVEPFFGDAASPIRPWSASATEELPENVGAIDLPFVFQPDQVQTQIDLVPASSGESIQGAVKPIIGTNEVHIYVPVNSSFGGPRSLYSALDPEARRRMRAVALTSSLSRSGAAAYREIDEWWEDGLFGTQGTGFTDFSDDEIDAIASIEITQQEFAAFDMFGDMLEAAYREDLEQWACTTPQETISKISGLFGGE